MFIVDYEARKLCGDFGQSSRSSPPFLCAVLFRNDVVPLMLKKCRLELLQLLCSGWTRQTAWGKQLFSLRASFTGAKTYDANASSVCGSRSIVPPVCDWFKNFRRVSLTWLFLKESC